MMRIMGLPGTFGETKNKKEKENRRKNIIDNFFKMVCFKINFIFGNVLKRVYLFIKSHYFLHV